MKQIRTAPWTTIETTIATRTRADGSTDRLSVERYKSTGRAAQWWVRLGYSETGRCPRVFARGGWALATRREAFASWAESAVSAFGPAVIKETS